ncbi:restriction endonuclease subunit S [Klebsiella quasipneumoniae subsp. similipneumoniae]|uniref:restriction endonuclease subunit S n=1 Tax=Klebsiella quasipneumoniae TaxID=1463165 RepID=UPI001FB61C97|nr:restriction endonuclease subunit S [Klebsiella quasipneumoniae]MCJ1843779.1 restriction endonuclease subunit S [Klebsiella quasipneumoniae subsp. similipneumoniae]
MVPKGWEQRDLNGLISIRHGFAFKSEYFKSHGDYVLLTPGSFNESGGFRNQGSKTKYYSGSIPDDYLLSKGDLLLAMTEQAEGLLGSPLFVPEDNKYLHNQRLGLVEINRWDRVCPEFIYLFFNNPNIRRQITEKSTGTKVKHTSPGRLCSVTGLIPPLPEQKKIAQILSTWDSAISVTEKLLTNSQQQKKALMQQLLTGKKRLLDESGERFSGEWVRNVSLGSVVELRKGVQINKDTLTEYGKYPVINGGITPSGFTSEFNTATNTITISEGGNSCGFIAIQKTPFWCGGHCYAVVKTELDNAFMFQLLKFNELKIMGLRVGSGLPNIQKKSLELFTVTYPAIHAEQQKIASILSAADAEISTLERKLACLKDEKKALMQQLLTGKRRVVVDGDVA